MNQPYPQLDTKTIATLKVARNQVIQADKIRDENRHGGQNPAPKQTPSAGTNKFAEEFVQKLASIEQEKATVDEEMANVEKLWSSLVEKKKKLEDRSNELTKVKDKLKELDKEITDFLSKRSEL